MKSSRSWLRESQRPNLSAFPKKMFSEIPQTSPAMVQSTGHNLCPGSRDEMLTLTFRHFKGIGAKTERELWRSGIASWDQFASRHAVQLSMFSFEVEDDEAAQVRESVRAFGAEDADYFARGLPNQE